MRSGGDDVGPIRSDGRTQDLQARRLALGEGRAGVRLGLFFGLAKARKRAQAFVHRKNANHIKPGQWPVRQAITNTTRIAGSHNFRGSKPHMLDRRREPDTQWIGGEMLYRSVQFYYILPTWCAASPKVIGSPIYYLEFPADKNFWPRASLRRAVLADRDVRPPAGVLRTEIDFFDV